MACAIASLLYNKNDLDKICIYIITDGITKQNIQKINNLKSIAACEIRFINIDKNLFAKCPLPKEAPHISHATYYRFMLPELLADTDKILYLDCDINIVSNLNELYNTDISNYYFAGVSDVSEKECCKRLNLTKYCNAGVLLINLKKCREENISEKLFEYCAEHYNEIKWGDQDVLNKVLQDKILVLEKVWNTQTCDKAVDEIKRDAKIIHYLSRKKPWMINYNLPLREVYIKYLGMTSWKNKCLLYRIYGLISKLTEMRKTLIRIHLSKKEKAFKLYIGNKNILHIKGEKHE